MPPAPHRSTGPRSRQKSRKSYSPELDTNRGAGRARKRMAGSFILGQTGAVRGAQASALPNSKNRRSFVYLTAIKLRHFRNVETLDWRPAPGLNLICGKNGQGKTNLLEGIYLALTG